MINQKLIAVAQHMWDIRTRLQEEAMDRSSMELVILELGEIRTGITTTQATNETELQLQGALEILVKAAEDEILHRLAALPPELPDSFYRDTHSLSSSH